MLTWLSGRRKTERNTERRKESKLTDGGRGVLAGYTFPQFTPLNGRGKKRHKNMQPTVGLTNRSTSKLMYKQKIARMDRENEGETRRRGRERGGERE